MVFQADKANKSFNIIIYRLTNWLRHIKITNQYKVNSNCRMQNAKFKVQISC